MPRRTVQRAIAGLEAKRIIVREKRGRRGGGRGANRYRILTSNPYEGKEQRCLGGAFGGQRCQGGANKGARVARDLVQEFNNSSSTPYPR